MIKIAFLVDYAHYNGGLNYINSLLSALALVNDGSVSPYVFVGNDLSLFHVDRFKINATVVQSPYFTRKSPHWFVHKCVYKTMGILWPINRLMSDYGIDIVSHSEVCGYNLSYKTMCWIPDFQFKKLPNMYSFVDRLRANRLYLKYCKQSDILVLSSYDSKNHLSKYSGEYLDKARVLQFVVTPDHNVYDMTLDNKGSDLENHYCIKGKYFYLPNQFWKHKNHLAVFKAVKLLKDRGVDVTVICSGAMQDFRNKDHINNLCNYLKENNLIENIKLLGVIPYEHVQYFMRNCVSIINPSLFEGWSTTVEEAKSLGKNIILSNINVHLEQNPAGGSYFAPDDPVALSEIVYYKWCSSNGGPDYDLEAYARAALNTRIREFGNTYLRYVLELYSTAKRCPN